MSSGKWRSACLGVNVSMEYEYEMSDSCDSSIDWVPPFFSSPKSMVAYHHHVSIE